MRSQEGSGALRAFAYFFAVVAILLAGQMAMAAATPVVLYTDLLSGPNTGGENSNGTYLSIFGKNFGTSGLETSTKVFIGGVEVASYRYLGASRGRPDVQQITVQIGPLGTPTPGVALPINVQVNGVNSTSFTPQTFIVNPGRILYLSLTGNDGTALANDITHPWRYMQTSAATKSVPTGVSAVAQAGDVIVMRGGTWTDLGLLDGTYRYFLKMLGVMLGKAPTGASGTGPIAITAYPTETVTIQPPTSSIAGVFDGVNSSFYVDGSGNPLYSQWITFSNLVIPTGGTNDGPINLNVFSHNWRVVNNDLSAPDAVSNKSGGVTGDGFNDAVLGNHIHNIAGNLNEDHGVYFDSGNGYEIAYNFIENITGGNGIQTYNSGSATPTIYNVNIHHNWIHDVNKHGINIADTSATGVTIWSNVVYNTVIGCFRNNSTLLQGAKIWNNTFYNCDTGGGHAALMNDVYNKKAPITMDFKNNVVWPSTLSAKYGGGAKGFVGVSGVSTTGNKNLFFNGNNPTSVSFDANAIFSDPLFVNTGSTPPDFHLQGMSPAINSGDTGVSTLVTSNYDLLPLPNSSGAFDRGAY